MGIAIALQNERHLDRLHRDLVPGAAGAVLPLPAAARPGAAGGRAAGPGQRVQPAWPARPAPHQAVDLLSSGILGFQTVMRQREITLE